MTDVGLRERKKAHTRQAIADDLSLEMEIHEQLKEFLNAVCVN